MLRDCAVGHVGAIAAIAQLGERQTEDLKVPGSIPGLGIFRNHHMQSCSRCGSKGAPSDEVSLATWPRGMIRREGITALGGSPARPAVELFPDMHQLW